MPRPRKYQTEAEVKAANVAKTQRYRQRKKLRDQQPLPTLPDAAMSTPETLGIRALELNIPAEPEDDYPLQPVEDPPLDPPSIPTLPVLPSPHTPDSYPAPSIPRGSISPESTATIILEDIPEPAQDTPKLAQDTSEPAQVGIAWDKVEVVDLADCTDDLDSNDDITYQELEERKIVFKKALASQLLRFHGCGSTDKENAEHQEIAPEGSVGLEVFVEPIVNETVLDTLGDNKLMELNSHKLTAKSWEKLYTGHVSDDNTSYPPVVSLLKAKQSMMILSRPPKIQWDVDSILAFPKSLAFAAQGIIYSPNPHITTNITTDVHLTMSVPDLSDPDRPRYINEPLKKVPHYCFGKVNGFERLNVFFFFPRLYDAEHEFVKLTDKVLQHWTDNILLLAIYEHMPSGHTQHLPGSWTHGQLASYAAGYEKAQRKTSRISRQQAIGISLQSQFLNPIWRSILRLVERPGYCDFKEVQLFLNGKNLKMAYKHRTSSKLYTHIRNSWRRCINTVYIDDDRLYLDIGKEIIGPDTFLEDEPIPADTQPQVYLWRRCCLKSYITWFRQACNTKTKESSMSQLYNEGFLQEAAQLTVLAPPRSIARQSGLVYSQFYASSKEMFDSAKTYPFANDKLEVLAIDPVLRKAWAKKGNAESFDSQVIQDGYIHSKMRCHAALLSSYQKSFGVREEHRVTMTLFSSLMDILNAEVQNSATPDVPPPSVWVLPSQLYIPYLACTIGKFTTGFEHTLSLCHQDIVSWEHTKVMCMFLRCLRFCIGGQLLERESGLWWDKRRREVSESYVEDWNTNRRLYEEDKDGRIFQISEGMGMEKTIKTYQYGWLMNKVNWNTFTFKEDNGNALLFGNRVLQVDEGRKTNQANRDTVTGCERRTFLLESIYPYWDTCLLYQPSKLNLGIDYILEIH